MRLGDKPVTRREVAVGGLIGDVAARLVAIRAAEMMRAQLEPPKPPKKPPPPTPPTPDEIDLRERPQPHVDGSAAATGVLLPAAHGALAGPTLDLGFRALGLGEHLFGSLLAGSTNAGSMRWLEVGLAADDHVWLSSRVRMFVGGAAALASTHFGDVESVDSIAAARNTWSARAGGLVGVEVRVARPFWITAALEPAAILRPIPFAGRSPQAGPTIEGGWVGLRIGLRVERAIPQF